MIIFIVETLEEQCLIVSQSVIIGPKRSKKQAKQTRKQSHFHSLSFFGSMNGNALCESIKYDNDGYTVWEAQTAANVYSTYMFICTCVRMSVYENTS